MEAAALRLQKESKGYLDSLRGTFFQLFTGTAERSDMLTRSSHDRLTDAHR